VRFSVVTPGASISEADGPDNGHEDDAKGQTLDEVYRPEMRHVQSEYAGHNLAHTEPDDAREPESWQLSERPAKQDVVGSRGDGGDQEGEEERRCSHD